MRYNETWLIATTLATPIVELVEKEIGKVKGRGKGRRMIYTCQVKIK